MALDIEQVLNIAYINPLMFCLSFSLILMLSDKVKKFFKVKDSDEVLMIIFLSFIPFANLILSGIIITQLMKTLIINPKFFR